MDAVEHASHRPANDAPTAQRIRSFVRRQGRLTRGQERALSEHWSDYGLAYTGTPLDLAHCYGRSAPVTLEIGFGNGETLAAMAAAAPERDFLGIEVHRPGVGHLLHCIETQGLRNLRVICHDAVDVMRHMIPPHSLDRIQIFFPDPWPKKRHHKRRLIQSDFVTLLAQCLQPGGLLHLATDWAPYGEHMQAVIADFPVLQPLDAASLQQHCPRPKTKFEQRGEQHGHSICELAYRRGA